MFQNINLRKWLINWKKKKGSIFVEAPEIVFLKRTLNYQIPLDKAIVKDSVKYLRVRVKSMYAEEMRLMMHKIKLNKGESLFFYSSDKQYISKSYTQYDVNDYGILSSPIIKTDELILEYNSTNFDSIGRIEIESASHFFPDNILKSSIITARSGNCLWDVNCSQFDDFCNQIRSANFILMAEGGACSGALINNPKNDYTHYVLTAQHCIEDFEPVGINVLYVVPVVGAILDLFFDVKVRIEIPIDDNRDLDTDIRYLSVVYNYQNPKCMNDDNMNYGINKMISTGADWAKVSGYFNGITNLSNDIAVLKMNRKPEWQWNVYYAGWTTETDRGRFKVNDVKSVSHPERKDKKFAEGELLLTTFPAAWFVWWNKGIVLPGSSGGPL